MEPKEPFVIGLFCGTFKPNSAAEYLQDFITDATLIQDQGVESNGHQYQIELSAFICDTPARAFIKNVKSHTGYSGCDNCTQPGVHIDNRMTFPESVPHCGQMHLSY